MVIMFPPRCPFFKYVYNRVRYHKKLWLQTTVGNSREGKTLCNISMAEHIDPKFNISKIVFTPKEFLDAVEDIKRAGECIVFSEIGVAHSSRQWHSLSNLLTNEVMQTMGYTHPVVLFDVPDFSYIDSQARKIMNCLCTVTRPGRGPARMWLNIISINRKDGSTYWPRPQVVVDGELVMLRSIIFKRLPTKALLKEFVKKEEDYKERVREKNKNILNAMEVDSVAKTRTLTDDIDYVIENIDEFKDLEGKVSTAVIQTMLGLSSHKAYQIKKMAEIKIGRTEKDPVSPSRP